MALLKPYHPDFCMLAGYMLIVGDEMCLKYDMINLHPALPGGPTGTWQEVIWKLIDTGADRSGIMMHLATPDLDRGPVVTYCSYSIKGKPFDRYWKQIAGLTSEQIKSRDGEDNALFKLIRQYGYTRELPLIVLTLKSLCDNKVKIISGKVYSDNDQLIKGYDLSSEVDKLVTEQ